MNGRKESETFKEVGTNPYDYPFEYFSVQAQFAAKWSQITGEPISESLYQRTSMHRRLFGNKFKNERSPGWNHIVDKAIACSTAEEISRLFWDEYTATPWALYVEPENKEGDGRHFGSFA